MKTVVFFDTETGGLDCRKHPIIQIAAAAADWETLDVIATFEAKIQVSEADCEPEALKLNSYDAAVWANEAEPDHIALSRLSDFLRGNATLQMTSKAGRPYWVAQLAAYNAAFDQEFLFAAFKRLDYFLPAAFSVLCTLQRVRWHFAEQGKKLPSNRLADVCSELGISLNNAHDAQADNFAQIEVLKAIRKAVAHV